jgi:mannose-6-phosphate isomerase-like protein (cupin superfamily)
MESEDEVAVLAAGQGLTLRPGIAHKARNGSTMEVRFLVISEPPSHGDRVET